MATQIRLSLFSILINVIWSRVYLDRSAARLAWQGPAAPAGVRSGATVETSRQTF
jgi:hypothetical protein